MQCLLLVILPKENIPHSSKDPSICWQFGQNDLIPLKSLFGAADDFVNMGNLENGFRDRNDSLDFLQSLKLATILPVVLPWSYLASCWHSPNCTRPKRSLLPLRLPTSNALWLFWSHSSWKDSSPCSPRPWHCICHGWWRYPHTFQHRCSFSQGSIRNWCLRQPDSLCPCLSSQALLRFRLPSRFISSSNTPWPWKFRLQTRLLGRKKFSSSPGSNHKNQ